MTTDFINEVDYVARLARLSLKDEEKQAMAGQLSDILETARKIQEIDTTGVEPTSHVIALPTAFREDLPRPSLPNEKALANAPWSSDGLFRVPSITAVKGSGKGEGGGDR